MAISMIVEAELAEMTNQERVELLEDSVTNLTNKKPINRANKLLRLLNKKNNNQKSLKELLSMNIIEIKESILIKLPLERKNQ